MIFAHVPHPAVLEHTFPSWISFPCLPVPLKLAHRCLDHTFPPWILFPDKTPIGNVDLCPKS